MLITALPSPGQLARAAQLRTEMARCISTVEILSNLRAGKAVSQADSMVDFLNAAITALAPFSSKIAGTAPWLQSAVLNPAGTSLVLTFNGTFSAATPATSAFAVVASTDASVAIASVTVNGSTVTLALTDTISSGSTATVA